MKISFMLTREDFYTINQQTLNRFFGGAGEQEFYIYPQLNAIVAKHPSKAVRQYLYTEYRVQAALPKRLAVWGYVRAALHSAGRMAANRCRVPENISADTLIYPCNKKIRIFDFAQNTVSVTPKAGFPTGDLQNEIDFRTKNTADFIPTLLSWDENGYTEQIIDGYPLARAGARTEELMKQAVSLWKAYIEPQTKFVPAKDYAAQLSEKATEKIAALRDIKPRVDFTAAIDWVKELARQMQTDETVPVTLSHGDFQAGNIWVENQTDRIFIIDWESYAFRSAWYDDTVLYDDLRKETGLSAFAENRDLRHTTVLLEDFIFRLEELGNLPQDYGTPEFDHYLNSVTKGKENV